MDTVQPGKDKMVLIGERVSALIRSTNWKELDKVIEATNLYAFPSRWIESYYRLVAPVGDKLENWEAFSKEALQICADRRNVTASQQ